MCYKILLAFNINKKEIGAGGDTYELYYSSSNSGKITYKGNDYYPGQRINPFDKGTSSLTYTGLIEGTHNIEFFAVSSSNATKSANINLRYTKYVEPFSFTANAQNGRLIEGEEFDITINANATNSHNPDVTYNVVYEFDGASIGSIRYNGTIYNSGDIIPITYGTSTMRYIPNSSTKQEDFTLNFKASNSTGETANDSESVDIYQKPVVFTKGETHNVSCGGPNGCDYESRVYICWDSICSKAYNGASIKTVKIGIQNKSGSYDNLTFDIGEAYGAAGEKYFVLEKFGKESSLNYSNQTYEIYIIDSNGVKSDTEQGYLKN